MYKMLSNPFIFCWFWCILDIILNNVDFHILYFGFPLVLPTKMAYVSLQLYTRGRKHIVLGDSIASEKISNAPQSTQH